MASIDWDDRDHGYYIRNNRAKKRYGPYVDMDCAREEHDFHVDFGRRARGLMPWTREKMRQSTESKSR